MYAVAFLFKKGQTSFLVLSFEEAGNEQDAIESAKDRPDYQKATLEGYSIISVKAAPVPLNVSKVPSLQEIQDMEWTEAKAFCESAGLGSKPSDKSWKEWATEYAQARSR